MEVELQVSFSVAETRFAKLQSYTANFIVIVWVLSLRNLAGAPTTYKMKDNSRQKEKRDEKMITLKLEKLIIIIIVAIVIIVITSIIINKFISFYV